MSDHLLSTDELWAAIFYGDNKTLERRLNKDPSVVNKLPEKVFHPGNIECKGWTSLLKWCEGVASYIHEETGIPEDFSVVLSLVTTMPITLPISLLYGPLSWTRTTLSEQASREAERKSKLYVTKDMTLLHYALLCQNLGACKLITATNNQPKEQIALISLYLDKISKWWQGQDKPIAFDRLTFAGHLALNVAHSHKGLTDLRGLLSSLKQKYNSDLTKKQSKLELEIAELKQKIINLQAKRNTETDALSHENEKLHTEISDLRQEYEKNLKAKNNIIAELRREINNPQKDDNSAPPAHAANTNSFHNNRQSRRRKTSNDNLNQPTKLAQARR